LIYLGDEVGTLNDYSYEQDDYKFDDSRWVHRPRIDWEKMARRSEPGTIEARVFQPLTRLITIRKQHNVFGGNQTLFVETNHPNIFGYIHWEGPEGLLALANFSDLPQDIPLVQFRVYGVKARMFDLITEEEINLGRGYTLQPYQFLWLVNLPS
jgi:amylosucrase